MTRPRLLVLTSTYPRWHNDTTPRFVHELARRLTVDFEVHVVAPHAARARTRECIDGVEVHRFRYLPARFETLAYGAGMLPGLKNHPWRLLALPLFLAAEWYATLRMLRSSRFTAIHAHWILPHGLIALAARIFCGYRPTLVCTSHGSDLFSLDAAWFRYLKRRVLRSAEVITVVSAALQRKAAALVPGVRAHIIPMGVDTDLFSPPTGIHGRDGVLFVGRLVPDKGLGTLLEALAILAARGIAPRLTVIGDGPAKSALQHRTHALGLQDRVSFLGARPNLELPPYYRQARLTVFPSLLGKHGSQEGMGLVPLEALACGCPVVASHLPAVSESIHDRETGLLFQPGKPASLADCMQEMLTSDGLATQLASAGQAMVTTRYGWGVISARYRSLL